MVRGEQIVLVGKSKKDIARAGKQCGCLIQRRQQIRRRHANIDMPAATGNVLYRRRICAGSRAGDCPQGQCCRKRMTGKPIHLAESSPYCCAIKINCKALLAPNFCFIED